MKARTITIGAIVLAALCAGFAIKTYSDLRDMRKQRDAAQVRAVPCDMLARIVPSITEQVKKARGVEDLNARTRPVALALMPVAAKCSGDINWASGAATRLAEAWTVDAAIGALQELELLFREGRNARRPNATAPNLLTPSSAGQDAAIR